MQTPPQTEIPWALEDCDHWIEYPEILVAPAATQDPTRSVAKTQYLDLAEIEFSSQTAQHLKAAVEPVQVSP